MRYRNIFEDKVNALKASGEYRVFRQIDRVCGEYL